MSGVSYGYTPAGQAKRFAMIRDLINVHDKLEKELANTERAMTKSKPKTGAKKPAVKKASTTKDVTPKAKATKDAAPKAKAKATKDDAPKPKAKPAKTKETKKAAE